MPDASVVASAVIVFEKTRRSVIFTVSDTGTLEKVWDVAPYEAQAIGCATNGDVLTLNTKISDTDYPTVIRYAKDGTVVASMLSVNLVAGGKLYGTNSAAGQPKVVELGGRTVVWLPYSRQLFELAADGSPETKYELGTIFEKIEKSLNLRDGRVFVTTLTTDGKLLLEVGGWNRKVQPNSPPEKHIILLDPKTLTWGDWFISSSNPGLHFTGLDAGNNIVLTEHTESGSALKFYTYYQQLFVKPPGAQ